MTSFTERDHSPVHDEALPEKSGTWMDVVYRDDRSVADNLDYYAEWLSVRKNINLHPSDFDLD
jgi:hypothetical protein